VFRDGGIFGVPDTSDFGADPVIVRALGERPKEKKKVEGRRMKGEAARAL